MTEETTLEITPKISNAAGRQLVTDVVDPFSISGDELKKVTGLSDARRKQRSRKMEKVYSGHEGSGTKRDERPYHDVTAYNLFGVVLPHYNLEYFARIYEMSAPHYAAINAKVSNIVGLGYDFVESHKTRRKIEDADKAKKDKIRRQLGNIKEALYTWLDGCNIEDTFTETLQKVWIDYEVTGNGYIEIGRTLSGQIGYIGHIPSTTMRIRQDRDGYVQMVSNRAKFFRNFGDRVTTDPIGNDPEPNEIIHIKKYSPTNQYYGTPDVVAAQQAVVGNEFASRFNLDYFENKAVPRYVIVVKGAPLSSTGEKNLMEFFETGLKGRNHRTIYVPLPADETDRKSSFEMKPVEAGSQDSSFVNYRRGNLSDILMAHRVPINKVSLSENVSLAAARDADKTFKEQVCRPEQRILEKKLGMIVGELTDVFNLKLNELSLTDEDTQSKIDERYFRFGALTPNEYRRQKGMEALPDGDMTFLEAQAKYAKQAAAQQRAEQTAQTTQSRTRDADRSAGGTDSNGEGRNEQGAGRAQA